MADILLIQPTYRGRQTNDMPHGLMALATALRAVGHDVKIFDAHVRKLTPADTLREIAGRSFDLVGIGGISTSYAFWKSFTTLFRERYGNNIPIMAGGSVAATMPELFLRNVAVDAMATGDGEPVAAALAGRLLAREPLENIPGVGFLNNDRLFLGESVRVKDMDAHVGWPAYDLIDPDDYRYPLTSDAERRSHLAAYGVDAPDLLEMALFSSRGCPHNCFFCSRNFGRRFVQHSVDHMMDHIRHVIDGYHPDILCFADEMFTTRRSWVLDFCARYRAFPGSVPFRINTRVDAVDPEMMAALKTAKCFEIDFGIESGSEKILLEMNKKVTVRQNTEALRMSAVAGIYANPTIVFGMPSETPETIRETEAFLLAADVKSFGAFFATAYPASALFDHAVKLGLISDVDAYMSTVDNASRLVINFTRMTDGRLKRLARSVIRRVEMAWYRRRGMIWREWALRLRLRGATRLARSVAGRLLGRRNSSAA